MQNYFNALTKVQNLPDLHHELRILECSCQELDNTINFIPPVPGDPFEEALAAFLKTIRSYRHGSADEFRGIAESMEKWRHVPDKRARFLTGRGHCLLATHYWRQGNLSEAENYANEAGVIGRSFDFRYLEAESLQVLARIKSAGCEWDIAERIADLARSKFTQNGGDIHGQALAWDALGLVKFEQGRFAQARQDLETSLSLWRNCLDECGMVDTMLLYIHLFYHLQEFETCSRFLNEAEAQCNNLSYQRGLGTIARYRGKICLLEKNLDEATRLFLKSLSIFNSIGAPDGQARAHLSLARAYAEQNEYDKSFLQYNKAREIFKAMKDQVREAMVLVTEGLLLARKNPNNKKESVKCFEGALKIFEDRNDQRHIATAKFDIGRQYGRWGDYEKSMNYIDQAMQIATSMQAKRLVERFQTEMITVEARKHYSLMCEEKEHRKAIYLVLNGAIHDIKNLVQKLISPWPPKEKCYTNYLQCICSGMMDVGKTGEGKLEMKEAPALSLLHGLVDNAITIVRPSNSKINIINQVDSQLLVLANENHLLRILVNLIGNSYRYAAMGTQEPKIIVRAEKIKEGGSVTITVEDTGPGIPEDARGEVFDLYKQAKHYDDLSNSQRAERGYGIGLAYCKLAVESHGGKIWVDTKMTRTRGENPKLFRPPFLFKKFSPLEEIWNQHSSSFGAFTLSTLPTLVGAIFQDYHGTVIHFTLPNNRQIQKGEKVLHGHNEKYGKNGKNEGAKRNG
ncbi:MAG: tetratricopeptide repeat protein [Candidatus Eremiobacteraeota bacterium]|nr:tetratricopeptide repeat protein [Candidatus Eremiobacteraeota bacterium]